MTINYLDSKRLQGLSTERGILSSGNGSIANGTNVGGGFTNTTGKIGNGWAQTHGHYTNINNQEWGLGNNGWSFNFWVNPQAPSGNDYFLQMNDETNPVYNAFYMFYESGLGLRTLFFDDTGTQMTTGDIMNLYVSVNNNAWNMITLTWNSTDKYYRLYRNGVFISSTIYTHTNAGNFGIPNKNWTLGNYSTMTDSLYSSRANGLDEWSFWEATLTQSEITELYNSGNGKRADTLSTSTLYKLKVYYDFEDTAGNTLTNRAPASVFINNLPNIQTNSTFEETDTNIRHWYNGTSWNTGG